MAATTDKAPAKDAARELPPELDGQLGIDGGELHDPVPEPDAEPAKRGPGRPRGSRSRSPRKRKPSDSAPRNRRPAGAAALTRQLESRITAIGQIVAVVEPFDGACIIDGAPRLAAAWAELAAVNPAVKRILEGTSVGGAWFGAIAATGSVALPIVLHHFPQIADTLAFPFKAPPGEPEPAGRAS